MASGSPSTTPPPRDVGEGSKALCMQRETLEIWDRLGIGQRAGGPRVQWRIGRTYFRGRELFSVHAARQRATTTSRPS